MSAKQGVFTATDWMAYYEELFQNDTPINVSPLSMVEDGTKEQSGEKDKDSSKDQAI
jgi:hypothetical protein